MTYTVSLNMNNTSEEPKFKLEANVKGRDVYNGSVDTTTTPSSFQEYFQARWILRTSVPSTGLRKIPNVTSTSKLATAPRLSFQVMITMVSLNGRGLEYGTSLTASADPRILVNYTL